MNRVPLDFHTVNIMLTMKQPIDIPGCIGIVPVFISQRAAELYRLQYYCNEGCTISPWASRCEEQNKETVE